MIYNKSNTEFSEWWTLLCKYAFAEYGIILQYKIDSTLMYSYYEQGMDLEEAMITYKEAQDDDKMKSIKMHEAASKK